MVRFNLMATVLFRHGFDHYLSLSMRGRYNNEIAEWKWPPIFRNKGVRYARADELELYSSSTTLPVQRRHQLMSRFYSRSRFVGGLTQAQPASRMRYSKFIHTTPRTTDAAPMLFAGCQNSTS